MARFMHIDLMVSGSSPPSTKISIRVKSLQLSVIPGVGITKRSHIERKDQDIAR